MVCDDHEVADMESHVDTAGRIRHKEILDAEDLHHPDRKSHELHRIAFIIMEASLHGHDEFSAQLSCYEVALMTYCCRHRETWYLLIWNHYRIFYFIGKLSKTAAKHYACKRLSAVKFRRNVFCGLHDLLYSWVHSLSLNYLFQQVLCLSKDFLLAFHDTSSHDELSVADHRIYTVRMS